MATAPKMKLLGGLDPETLCETYGTPLYVYSAETILERLEIFHAAFAALPHRILYAAKALSPVEILRLFKEEGTGLDGLELQFETAAGRGPSARMRGEAHPPPRNS